MVPVGDLGYSTSLSVGRLSSPGNAIEVVRYLFSELRSVGTRLRRERRDVFEDLGQRMDLGSRLVTGLVQLTDEGDGSKDVRREVFCEVKKIYDDCLSVWVRLISPDMRHAVVPFVGYSGVVGHVSPWAKSRPVRSGSALEQEERMRVSLGAKRGSLEVRPPGVDSRGTGTIQNVIPRQQGRRKRRAARPQKK